MKLIGQGETAKVYLVGNRVVKIFNKNISKDYALKEYHAVREIGLAIEEAPNVYEFYQGEALGYYMDYIKGKTIDVIMTQTNYKDYSKELGVHHRLLHKKVLNLPLISLKDNLKRFISSLSVYDEWILEWLLELLNTLEDGNSILHGDYMPYNILEGFKVLDWSDVMKGPAEADVARTIYFMLESGDRKFPVKNIVKHYLEGYYKDRIPFEVLHKWLIINAALAYAIAVDENTLSDYFNRLNRFVENNYKDLYSDKLFIWE